MRAGQGWAHSLRRLEDARFLQISHHFDLEHRYSPKKVMSEEQVGETTTTPTEAVPKPNPCPRCRALVTEEAAPPDVKSTPSLFQDSPEIDVIHASVHGENVSPQGAYFDLERVFSPGDWMQVDVKIRPSWEVVQTSMVVSPVGQPPKSVQISLLCLTCGAITDEGQATSLQLSEEPSFSSIHFILLKSIFNRLRAFRMELFGSGEDSSQSVAAPCHRVRKTFFFRLKDMDGEKFRGQIRIWTPSSEVSGLLKLGYTRKFHPFWCQRSTPVGSNIWWFHRVPDTYKILKREPPPGWENYIEPRSIAVNHLMLHEKVNLIGHKKILTKVLRLREEETSQFYPKSFIISDEEERQAFVKQMEREDDPNQVWIIKPSASAEGRGMMMLAKVDGAITLCDMGKEDYPLESVADAFPDLCDPGLFYGHLAQRYILNPLLWDGHKIGIRQFWLVASLRPLRVLIYDTGFLTFASTPYERANFGDKTIHLTNYDQQPAESKPEFKYVRDIETYLVGKGLAEPGFHEDVLRPQVKNVIRSVMACLQMTFNKYGYPLQGRRPDIRPFHPFEMFALDFVMDTDHRLWLNEVQMSFSVRFTGTCLKSQFMPEMLVEALGIVEEIRSHSQANGGTSYGLTEIRSVKRFSWLIGGPEEPENVEEGDG